MNSSFDALPDLMHAAMRGITLISVCSVRLFIIASIFPPTADGVLQGTVRNAIVLLFSTYVAYGQSVDFSASLHGTTLLEVGLREALIGLVLGFSASSVFWVAESAGYYVDDLTGYNNAQVSNPMRDEQSTPTASLLLQVATVAFWGLGGMTFLLGALYESYHWWPLSEPAMNMPAVLESFVLARTDSLMQAVAKLAAPMTMILLLIDIAFGYTAKSGSKLDLMSVSQPAKGAVTVLMIALFVGVFVDQVRDQLTLANFTAQWREWSAAMTH